MGTKRHPIQPLLICMGVFSSSFIIIMMAEYQILNITEKEIAKLYWGILISIPPHSISYELNWDFLSHVRADDDSTCDACLLGSDLEFPFSLLLVGNQF